MTTNRAYLVVPKLIEQPTWGGHYIMHAKGWDKHPAADTKIGQSYELFSESHLSLATNSNDHDFQPELNTIPDHAFPIEQMRAEDPEGVVGKHGMSIFKGELKTLIKFTQAKGNSFQLHVKEPTGKWLPKPESWYYFEKGMATLGIGDKAKMKAYKNACIDIEKYMSSLSKKTDTGVLTVEEARSLAKAYIAKSKIYEYVNTTIVPKDHVVALEQGGIHHSWEEDDKKIPNGNIVYEVQVDVMDDVSTLRSFDKGSIKDDGSIRDVQIDDYFHHLDMSKNANDVEKLIYTPDKIESDSCIVRKLFNTKYYKLDEIEIDDKLENELTNTMKETFHHIFVRDGKIQYSDSSISITVDQGHSLFVPSRIGRYEIKPKSDTVTILKTYV